MPDPAVALSPLQQRETDRRRQAARRLLPVKRLARSNPVPDRTRRQQQVKAQVQASPEDRHLELPQHHQRRTNSPATQQQRPVGSKAKSSLRRISGCAHIDRIVTLFQTQHKSPEQSWRHFEKDPIRRIPLYPLSTGAPKATFPPQSARIAPRAPPRVLPRRPAF